MINTRGTLHENFIEILQKVADGTLTDKDEVKRQIHTVELHFLDVINEWRAEQDKLLIDEAFRARVATEEHAKRADFIAACLLNPNDAMHSWALSFLDTVKAENAEIANDVENVSVNAGVLLKSAKSALEVREIVL